MNASLSDGNEPVIDIFILSANSPLSTQLENQLRDEGYYVTLFSEGTHLLETLRNGKPNLLMCDTTVPDADAFEVCRQIKSDDYLWNIPVLIISGASDLGDLLRVLDCNADNFIAHPFDPPYLLSLIEGMLTTPVERQTPEQIKTQFKIKHDDQVFVVTADRRKLLEFLLSSFEIAVNKSTDLTRAKDDKENLGTTIRRLEETVHENIKVISIINENLKSKEQKLNDLTVQLSDREETVREKIATIDRLSQDLSTEKTSLAEAQSEIQRVLKEKDESQAVHQATIDQLQWQVTDQSSELDTVKPALEHANGELLKESGLRKETETELSTTVTLKEEAEKALSALTTEYEQLKITFGTEKNRAEEAENELNAVLQAKNQSEQDLTGIINDLKNTAKEQAAALARLREESATVISQLKEESATEITRLREELESGNVRLRQTEESLNTLTVAKAQTEATLQATTDERQNLQGWLDTAKSQLEEKERSIANLNEEIATVRAVRKAAEEELASVSSHLEETSAALEADKIKIASQKEDLMRVYEEKEKAEALAESLSGSLHALTAELELEKGRAGENKERMKVLILERDQELGDLRTAHEETRTALSSHTSILEQMKRDLESAVSARTELEGKLNLADEKIQQISQALEGTSANLSEEKQRLTSIAGELDQAKTHLEQETLRRQEAEDQFRDALSRQQHMEQDLEQLVSETRNLHADLSAERRMHEDTKRQARSLEEQVSALHHDKTEAEKAAADLTAERRMHEDTKRQVRSLEEQVSALHHDKAEAEKAAADLTAERRMHEDTKRQARSLEEQVSALHREKAEAEKAAADLTAEIDQARGALVDEGEDSMMHHDRLMEATKNIPRPVPASYPGVRKEAEIIKKRSLIVKVPNIPSQVRPLPRSMVAIDPVKEHEPISSQIKSVEDLYEDDEKDGENQNDTPRVSIVQESNTEPVQDVLPDSIPSHSADHDSFFEDNGHSADTGDEDETNDNDEAYGSGQNIVFDRTAWLNLLKWSHHCDALEPEQRMHIVRLGRLIQKGRKLTKNQEEQVLELITLVKSLGYRMP
jgi:DNA-binding response OmpR family regulator/predicted  nucleic acid-binding Zn-ribbon protein